MSDKSTVFKAKGLDVGTSRLVLARPVESTYQYEGQLNAFISLPYSRMTEGMLRREGILFSVEGSTILAYGNRVEEFANILNGETRRPIPVAHDGDAGMECAAAHLENSRGRHATEPLEKFELQLTTRLIRSDEALGSLPVRGVVGLGFGREAQETLEPALCTGEASLESIHLHGAEFLPEECRVGLKPSSGRISPGPQLAKAQANRREGPGSEKIFRDAYDPLSRPV